MERIDLTKYYTADNESITEIVALGANKLFQWVYTDSKHRTVMHVSKKRIIPPYMAYKGIPLSLPFCFLSKNMNYGNRGDFLYFHELTPASKQDIRPEIQVPTAEIANRKCTASDISYIYNNSILKKRLYTDKAFPFFPLGYDHFSDNNELTQTYRVSEIGEAKSRDGISMCYPAKSVLTIFVANIKACTRIITIDSFDLNIPLDEGLYAVDPASVSIIFDEDSQTPISTPTE